MTKTLKAEIDESLIQSLSPFKKLIAEALNKGEYYWELEVRLARERNIPLASARAYVTMTINYMVKNKCIKRR